MADLTTIEIRIPFSLAMLITGCYARMGADQDDADDQDPGWEYEDGKKEDRVDKSQRHGNKANPGQPFRENPCADGKH